MSKDLRYVSSAQGCADQMGARLVVSEVAALLIDTDHDEYRASTIGR